MPDLLQSGLAKGQLRFTTDLTAVAEVSVHFISVGTPQKVGEYAADHTFIDAAGDSAPAPQAR